MAPCDATVVVVGHMGDGKSTLCNTLIGSNDSSAFRESSAKDAETLETIGKMGHFDGISVCAIDTPGYGENAGRTAAHTLKMAETIINNRDVQAFLIVLNYQAPRFDNELQNLFRLLASMYPDKPFLEHVIIVWTRYYPEYTSDAERAEAMSKPKTEFLKYLPGSERVLNSMPQFFLDSRKARTPGTADHNTVGYIIAAAKLMKPIAEDLGTARVKKGAPLIEHKQRVVPGATRTEKHKYGARRYGLFGPRDYETITYQKCTTIYEQREKQEYTAGEPTYTEWKEVRRETIERKIG